MPMLCAKCEKMIPTMEAKLVRHLEAQIETIDQKIATNYFDRFDRSMAEEATLESYHEGELLVCIECFGKILAEVISELVKA